VGHDLVLSAEVVLLNDLVRGEVVVGLAVADQHGLASTHRLPLPLKSFVRVATVNHPLSVVTVASMKRRLLQSRHRRRNIQRHRSRPHKQVLLMDVVMRLDFDFLTETDNGITSKHVLFLHTHHGESVTANRVCVHLRSV